MIYMYICTYMYIYSHIFTYIHIYSHIYIYIPTLGGYTPYVFRTPRLRRELAQVPNSTLERLLAGGVNGAWGNPVVTKYYPLVI